MQITATLKMTPDQIIRRAIEHGKAQPSNGERAAYGKAIWFASRAGYDSLDVQAIADKARQLYVGEVNV